MNLLAFQRKGVFILAKQESLLGFNGFLLTRNHYKLSSKEINPILTPNTQNAQPSRSMAAFAWFKRKSIRRPSAFLLGFGVMTGVIVLENVYDRYKRSSGIGLAQLLSFSRSSSSSSKWSVDDNSDTFQTKYASLIPKASVPNFNVSRKVSDDLKCS